MKTDWVIVAEICQEKLVDMDIIVRPEKYRDGASAAKRSCVLREAHKQGVAVGSLQTLCPMTERRIRMCVTDENQKSFSDLFPSNGIGVTA